MRAENRINMKKGNKILTNKLIRFHRSISNDFKGYAILLCIALMVPCLISIIGWLILGKDGWFHMYYVFGLNYPDGTSEHPHKWLYLLIGITGALVISGLMVTVFTNGVQRFVERIREGRHYYKGLRNHFVLIGYNNLSLSLIHHLLFDTDKQASLIILTKSNPSIIRAELQSSLDKSLEKRIIIYAADHDTLKQIENLNLKYAKEVYVLKEEDNDSQSLAILEQIAIHRGDRETNLLKVNVLINDYETYEITQQIKLPEKYTGYAIGDNKYKQNIDLHLFNFYENWAKLLWSYNGLKDNANGNYKYDALDFEEIENTTKSVHLVIVGFNDMGRALLMEALRVCHYPNYDEKTGANKTHITIVDPCADSLSVKFNSQYPYLKQIKDIHIDFCNAYIEEKWIRNEIIRCATDDKQMLTIAICLSVPNRALNIALTLPEEVYYQHDKVVLYEDKPNTNKYKIKANNTRPRVLVRQALMSSVDNIIQANNGYYKNLKAFGAFNEGINIDLLDDRLAICINGIYHDNRLYNGPEANEKSVKNVEMEISDRYNAWKGIWYNVAETPDYNKPSSRYQVDYYRSLLSILLRNNVFTSKDLLSDLAAVEHRRWIAERTLAGWRYADPSKGERRTDDLKLHTCIKPFSELPEDEKKKDRNVIAYANSLVNGLNNLQND